MTILYSTKTNKTNEQNSSKSWWSESKKSAPKKAEKNRNPSPEEKIRFIRAADREDQRRIADNNSVSNRTRKFFIISAAVLDMKLLIMSTMIRADRYLPAPSTQRSLFFSKWIN